MVTGLGYRVGGWGACEPETATEIGYRQWKQPTVDTSQYLLSTYQQIDQRHAMGTAAKLCCM